MGIEHAWLLKGWVLAQDAPQEITDAVDSLIAGLRRPPTASPANEIAGGEVAHHAGPPAAPPVLDIIGPKARKPWSPESRAAAAERMRRRQAGKKSHPPGEAPAPSHSGA